ncbi:DUF5305 family protein [Tuberibacillus sp. Marseille-P3662]|uniref:DUF5305 family protein n=1 Tax=Tuberibacillus sp. Marseille-P3662 TaxID=1965358 RepID=UPI000A1CD93A|nr:DUF5305 family protein [Tuberibacillus sp. Marseille-P3662]
MKDLLKQWMKQKIIRRIAIGLGMTSLFFSIYSFSQPSQEVETKQINSIRTSTTYTLEARVKPNVLYPEGTTLHPKKAFTTALADQLLIHMTIKVDSNRPVKVKGSFNPELVIHADDLWTKSFKLKSGREFSQTCQDCQVEETMEVKVSELIQYLNHIEDSLQIHPSNYVFHIKPQLTGSIDDKGKTFSLQDGDGLHFNRQQTVLSLADKEKLQISETYPIKNVIQQTNNLDLCLLQIPVTPARIIFSLLTILLVTVVIFTSENRKQEDVPEYAWIDYKYRKLLTPVKMQVNLEACTELELESFASLMFISEEKESPIFRYENKHEVLYFVPDEPFVYYYITGKR